MDNYNSNKQLCQDVDRALAEDRTDDALELLDRALADKSDADLYYRRGRLLWKLGHKTQAMSDYSRAVDLDPSSPAAAALEMARDIMDFFNHDLYNP